MSTTINFLEHFWDQVKRGEIQNYPLPVMLNQGLAYTVQLEDRQTTLLWIPQEATGLAYVERIPGAVDIHPYYRGMIVYDFEVSHGTDLYKPKTEEELFQKVYQRAWELQQAIQNLMQGEPYPGNAADYITKLHQLADWLRYYLSAKAVGGSIRLR
ncbi:hypothetical protein RAC89_11135 [Paenibacillus sp. GD4]|uniref:hypothetical protein n=1 Tax=Paenibacillus sp. GD4 TaxID=3068890 RepID=UPI0027968BEF|nr:hypothetical protein [Paenibacillus sp. GD4]MDQ1911005.1 hypothetical protein [Paenibacillus sp. GD4]